jgi:hypothetical protein
MLCCHAQGDGSLSLFFFRTIAFFDKRNILISKDTNYIQSLQQRSTLAMHTTKKSKES